MKAILILFCLQYIPWICSKDAPPLISPLKIEDSLSTLEIKSIKVAPHPLANDAKVLFISMEIQNLSDRSIAFERWKLEFIQDEMIFGVQPWPLPYVSNVLLKAVIEPKQSATFEFMISPPNLSSPIILKSNSAVRPMQPDEPHNITEFK